MLISSIALLSIPHDQALAAGLSGYNSSPWFEATGQNSLDFPDAVNLRLETFSLAVWFRTSTDFSGYASKSLIVNKGGFGSEETGQNMNYGIWIDCGMACGSDAYANKIQAGFEQGADGKDRFVRSKQSYNDGNWHYAAVTYDGFVLKLYVDGRVAASLNNTSGGAPDTTSTFPLRMGANSADITTKLAARYFTGQIDEIRLWSRAVSEAEVNDQYQIGTFNTAGIVLYEDAQLPLPDFNSPVIIGPPDKRVLARGALTEVDIGVPIVADREDTSLIVANDAPVDGVYPTGTTTVRWTVTDDIGNTATAEQTVTVIPQSSPPSITRTFCSSGCKYNHLQTAINSLPASGGKVYIGAGNYSMSKTIILKSGTTIEFDPDASIRFWGGSKPLFYGANLTNVKVIGGNITAERSGVKALAFISSSEIVVNGTHFTLVKGGNSNAFSCIDCSSVYISNINAKSASRLIDITTTTRTNDGKSTKIWIEDSILDNSSIEGIKVNQSRDVHIINNTVSNTGDNGIDIGWNWDSQVAYNKSTRTGYPNGAAIGADSAKGADIVQNYINITGRSSIQVYRAFDIRVGSNTIIDSEAQGISVITERQPSFDTLLIVNHIISPAGFGIYFSQAQGPAEIGNNIIEQMPPGIKAIYIAGAIKNKIVYGTTEN
jgi:hypothetical protein